MKVSPNFYLNEEKKNNRRDTIPIYVRVRLNGKKAERRLYHADIFEKEKLLWDKRTMRFIDPKHKANKIITSVQQAFDEFIIVNSRTINRHTSNGIRNYVLGRNKNEEPRCSMFLKWTITNVHLQYTEGARSSSQTKSFYA